MAFTRAAIVAKMAEQMALVPGIGLIHPRRRVMRTEDDIRTFCFVPATGRINGWFISPAANSTTVTDRKPGFSGIGQVGQRGTILKTWQFQIEGYFNLVDADDTETIFADLADAVAMHFNSIGKLLDAATHQLPCDIEQFGYARFANAYFCHYARLGFGLRGVPTN